MKQFYFFSTILFLNFFAYAQLDKGDLALVGVNSDSSPDELALVALNDIPSGQTIYISDYPWSGSAFETTSDSNGVLVWSTTSTVPAGTLLYVNITEGATPVVGGNLSTFGSVSTTGWVLAPIASGGDSWLIYQGASPTSVPTDWIFGFANWSTSSGTVAGEWRSSGTVTSTTSYLPIDLTLGTDAVGLTTVTYHADNMVYTGTLSGDKVTVLTEISNRSNWNGSETVTQDITVGGTNFPGTQPIFTITGGTLGVSSNSIKTQKTVYPNPTTHIVNINLRPFDNASIKVFSSSGQLIKSETNIKSDVYQFEITGAPGLYIVEIASAQGKKLRIKAIKK